MSGTSSSTHWNPDRYLAFQSERTRPLIDLISRVNVRHVGRIIDLGCGPGNGMAALRGKWPTAHILGVDSSEDMLSSARQATARDRNVEYLQSDIRSFQNDDGADLVVSNAALHWLPDHRQLLPQIQMLVRPGGALAVQLPGNFEAPSHRLLYDLAVSAPYADHVDLSAMIKPTSALQEYMLDVSATGWTVQAWETTYYHVLEGRDPVFEWTSGTAARPVLAALPENLRERFTREYKSALRQAYPPTTIGTILPFRRLFFIASREQ